MLMLTFRYDTLSTHVKEQKGESGVIAPACNPSIQEAEAGDCPGQPGLPSRSLSQK
jgi:hypothetical protein